MGGNLTQVSAKTPGGRQMAVQCPQHCTKQHHKVPVTGECRRGLACQVELTQLAPMAAHPVLGAESPNCAGLAQHQHQNQHLHSYHRYYHNQHPRQFSPTPHISPAAFADASPGYMARSRRSPSMKNRWRAEEDPRERHPHQPPDREGDRGGRRPHSPPAAHRGEPSAPYRGGHQAGRPNRPPHKKRHPSGNPRKLHGRNSSISPHRPFKQKHHHQSRPKPVEDRPGRPRDYSPTRFSKRRRTQSPSPPPSDRGPSGSQRPGRSRERSHLSDRRPPNPRPRSPTQTFPPSSSRPISPSQQSRGPDIEEYGRSDRRRSSPSYRRDKQSLSPRSASRSSPPHRQELNDISLETRDLSGQRIRPPKRPAPGKGRHPAKKSKRISRTPSVVDDTDSRSMDGQYPSRGNYGTHRGQQRPFVDTRQQQQYGGGGSPPFSSTPNSSYHGSPQANSPYHNQRGGWGGNQGNHG